jgi:thioredoxin-like negative regulator of GroEL
MSNYSKENIVFLSFVVLLCVVHVCDALPYTAGDPVEVLTDKNFKELVLNSQKLWLVEFYSPYCFHCKNMEGDFLKFAETGKDVSGDTVRVGGVNCSSETELCRKKYKINGVPHLKLFRPGKAPIEYKGKRTTAEFAAFCGRHRND